MRLTNKQIRELMDGDEPTSTICYHGVRIIHDHEDGEEFPVFTLRIIGHLLFDADDFTSDHDAIVPDHRTVSFDFPMHPETLIGVAESLVRAAKHEPPDAIAPPFPLPDNAEWIPVREMPDFLKRILGIDKDGE